MSANAESLRKHRRHKDPFLETDLNPPPQIPSIIRSTRCKSSISTLLLLSTCSSTDNTHTLNNKNNNDNNNIDNNNNRNSKNNNFTSGTLRGLGCAAASAQVSVPDAIRTSADWQAKKVRKKKKMKQRSRSHQHQRQAVAKGDNTSSSVLVVSDIWCVPGIGFTASSAAASVDCVVSRRSLVPVPVSGRGKRDGDEMNQRERERSSCNGRRTANPEHMLLDSESTFGRTNLESDIFGSRYYHHVRHPSPEGLAEIMLFRSGLLMGGRPGDYDRYREWRLDVDNMSYEELLELGDRIGYVNTGLREVEMKCCLKQTKLSVLNDLSLHVPTETESKCSICQEEYEADDEMGTLDCGHFYHIKCIRQWLAQKNSCPVCKSRAAEAAAQKEGQLTRHI